MVRYEEEEEAGRKVKLSEPLLRSVDQPEPPTPAAARNFTYLQTICAHAFCCGGPEKERARIISSTSG